MVTRNLTIYLSFLILEYTNSEQNKRKRELNVGRIIEQCGKLLCLLAIKLQWDSKCNKYIIQTRFCPTGKEDFKKEQKKKKNCKLHFTWICTKTYIMPICHLNSCILNISTIMWSGIGSLVWKKWCTRKDELSWSFDSCYG